MKISVITVAFNSAATIADTLLSVAAQTHKDIEHIVIDGASTDRTLDIVAQHGQRVSRVASEPDHGIYDAMNKGLVLATGEVVGFLNSDDVYTDEHVVGRIAAGLADSMCDALYGDLAFVDPGDTSRIVRFWRSCPHQAGMCLKGWAPPHPTLYVRRHVLMAARGFNVRFKLQADFELMLRLFEIQRIRSRYLSSTLVKMRMGGATTGSILNIIKGNLEAARACRENGYPGGLGFIARKMMRKLPQFVARPRGISPDGS